MVTRYTAATPLRWGILGCGAVTELKSGPAFNKVVGSSLVAVMRRDAARAEDYARRHGVPRWYSDADALIHDPEVDAVYVATPPGSHLELALRVARAGKPCCVEKPMALNADQCREMIQAFETAGQALFVAYYRRSLPRFLQVKDWLESGAIGSVRHAHWTLCRRPHPGDLAGEYHWHIDPALSGGGYFVDLACHGLDLLIHLLGDIPEAGGLAVNQQGLYPVEDAVTGHWRFASGATGSGFWNFGCQEREDQLVISGSQGRIECSVFDEQPVILRSARSEFGTQSLVIPHAENIQFHHIQNMVRHLNGEAVHPSLGRNALQASWVMDQMLRGYRTRLD